MICLSARAHGWPVRAVIAAGLALLAVLIGVSHQGYAGLARMVSAAPIRLASAVRLIELRSSRLVYRSLAQGDNDGGETEVPPGDIEKYVAVYKAMQRDRTLTVDQAAIREGLTLQSFRDLESRVERDDAALQRARDELQAAAVQTTPAGRPTDVAPAH